MTDPLGREYLENHRIGRDYIVLKHWPDDHYPWIKLARAKTEYRKLRLAYSKLIKMGEQAVARLESED